MSKNRYILFGYEMINGELVINTSESEIVKQVFDKYLQGLSLQSIASWLTAQKIEYLPSKYLWNKNRVKRMLEDERYIGKDDFQSIIDSEIFELVRRKHQERSRPQKTNDEVEPFRKIIFCNKCGERIARNVPGKGKPRWSCVIKGCNYNYIISDEMMSSICKQIKRISRTVKLCGKQDETRNIHNDDELFQQMLHTQSDIDVIKQTVFNMAQYRYTACDGIYFHISDEEKTKAIKFDDNGIVILEFISGETQHINIFERSAGDASSHTNQTEHSCYPGKTTKRMDK